MTETDTWREAFERLAARVSRVCDFDANESAAPEDERWARELDQLAEFARDIAHETEGDAVIPAGPGTPLDVAHLLSAGGCVSLRYDAGESGRCHEDGDTVTVPSDPGFRATAYDFDGVPIGTGGSGTSPTDALAHIHLHDYGPGPYRLIPPF